ncbi:ependymin-like 1 [Gouania willdenowi]|uniref:Ependymin-2-like n=1 Tax=Gouania willdenowi TaxID=441366 RepID=A0A8C5DMB9_GOUWI|nr:ependymin-2-like [Gouania willdenowi]
MRVLLVLTCLLAACLALRPKPCKSPPLLTGKLTVSTQNEELWMYAKFLYDALGERIRFYEVGKYMNTSYTKDYLLIYNKSTIYDINKDAKTCTKLPLKDKFLPLGVPKNASLLGQAILGSSSGPGQGLLVNTWTGELPEKGGQYQMTLTARGCIPVSFILKTDRFGWMLTSYFDNVIGIPDPEQLIPPCFCKDAEMKNVKPLDFFSLFHQKH